jgi:hypothetical protein
VSEKRHQLLEFLYNECSFFWKLRDMLSRSTPFGQHLIFQTTTEPYISRKRSILGFEIKGD